jgi:cytochrome P450
MQHPSDSLPPGPKRGFSPATLLKLSLDTLSYLASLVEEYGDVVHFRIGTKDVVLVNDPELIRNVLAGSEEQFAKGQVLEIFKHLLGEGLLTSEGEFHRSQRRLVQPSLHSEHINVYGNVVVNQAVRAQASWADGDTRDVAKEMARLTLQITGEAFFDSDLTAEAGEVRDSLYKSFNLLKWMMFPVLGERIQSFPPFRRRLLATRARLDKTIYRVMAEHGANGGHKRVGLLSALMAAQSGGHGCTTDVRVRDEVMTIILAGHETMANALTWAWYLLSQNPEAEANLHEELDSVLGGRAPAVEDIPELPYTRATLSESLRLYPPAWAIGRRALKDFKIGGYAVPAGAGVMLCQFLVHRDPRHFTQPSHFRPERWLNGEQTARHKFAFFPFGGGRRACIGEAFAWMEGVLLLSTLASRWKLRHVTPPRLKMETFITLRPKHGMKMAFTCRRTGRVDAPRALTHGRS